MGVGGVLLRQEEQVEGQEPLAPKMERRLNEQTCPAYDARQLCVYPLITVSFGPSFTPWWIRIRYVGSQVIITQAPAALCLSDTDVKQACRPFDT